MDDDGELMKPTQFQFENFNGFQSFLSSSKPIEKMNGDWFKVSPP
jgi:hypothetical protein